MEIHFTFCGDIFFIFVTVRIMFPDAIVFDLAKDIVTGFELQINVCVLPSQSTQFIKTSFHHIMFQHVTMDNSNFKRFPKILP